MRYFSAVVVFLYFSKFTSAQIILPCDSTLSSNSHTQGKLEQNLKTLFDARNIRERETATSNLMQPVQDRLHAYFWKRNVLDFHEREDLIQQTLFLFVTFTDNKRVTGEVVRSFNAVLFSAAKIVLLRFNRKRGRQSTFLPLVLPESAPNKPLPLPESRYFFSEGTPVPLTYRQLMVLKNLAAGNNYHQTASQLGLKLTQVFDTLGNIQDKLQKAAGAPAIKHSNCSYVIDISTRGRIFIDCTAAGFRYTFVGEGPILLNENELKILSKWISGRSLANAIHDLRLDKEEAQIILTRLLIERRHDYQELFGDREKMFENIIDLQISEADGEYALFKAFGIERPEIAKALGLSVFTLASRIENLKTKLKNATAHLKKNISFLRPYYSIVEDSRDEVRIVLVDDQQRNYLIRAKIVSTESRSYRNRNDIKIPIPRTKLVEIISGMPDRMKEIANIRILGGKTTPETAQKLGIRADQVRKHLADATYQIGVATNQPELNMFNLRIIEE